MNQKNIIYLLGATILFYPQFAFAYIGPGLGAGAVVAILGTLVGVLMLIVGVIWYPVKRLIRRLRSKK